MTSPSTRILRQPDFRRLWIADLLSQLGGRLGMIAIPLLAILDLNASALQVSLLRTCETAAWLLLGLVAGAWIDRVRCLPVMVWADLGRALLFGSIPAAAAFEVLTLPLLYGVLVLVGLLTVLFDVAHSAYPPRLLAPDQLLSGNAKLAANHSVAAVVGAGAGGFLVQWFTAPLTVALNALSFLWSSLWLHSIRTPEHRPAPPEQRHLRHEISEGLRYVFRHPLLRPITLNAATMMLFQAANNAVMVVFLVREVHLSPSTIGLLSMVGLLGAIAASAFTEHLSRRIGQARALCLAALTNGIGYLLYGLTGPGWRLGWYVAATLLASISIIVAYILQISARQLLCPPDLQGRVSATTSFVTWGAAPIGSLLGGLVATAAGPRFTIWLSGVAILVGAGWLLFSPLRTLRDIPTAEDLPVRR
ncbi:MAG TPA: MFS transporter [Kribbella sp.]|jgi:predicted MFS family arabinose efflux permease